MKQLKPLGQLVSPLQEWFQSDRNKVSYQPQELTQYVVWAPLAAKAVWVKSLLPALTVAYSLHSERPESFDWGYHRKSSEYSGKVLQLQTKAHQKKLTGLMPKIEGHS